MGNIEDLILSLKNETPRLNTHYIGWNCTYLPIEIINAAGLMPSRILPEPFQGEGDSYLDANFCPFIKNAIASAVNGKYHRVEGIIFINTCDGMRRLFDAWRYYCKPNFSFMLDVPRIIGEGAIDYFEGQLQELIDAIKREFNLQITDDALLLAIDQTNRISKLFKKLITFQGRGDPPLRHHHIVELMMLSYKTPRDIFIKALERLIIELESKPPTKTNGVKLMVIGSIQCSSELIRLIEKMGAEVIRSDFCTGGRILNEIEIENSPIRSLADSYLSKTPCARMNDSDIRLSQIQDAVRSNSIKGIIHVSMKFCDTYLYDIPRVKEALNEIKVPTLFLESECSNQFGGRIRTRIQAFLEMLDQYE